MAIVPAFVLCSGGCWVILSFTHALVRVSRSGGTVSMSEKQHKASYRCQSARRTTVIHSKNNALDVKLQKVLLLLTFTETVTTFWQYYMRQISCKKQKQVPPAPHAPPNAIWKNTQLLGINNQSKPVFNAVSLTAHPAQPPPRACSHLVKHNECFSALLFVVSLILAWTRCSCRPSQSSYLCTEERRAISEELWSGQHKSSF